LPELAIDASDAAWADTDRRMSSMAGRKCVDGNGAGSVGSDEAMVERGFDRWLNRQLHRIYDPVLGEPVPDEMLRLLDQFGSKPQAAAERDERDKS
jgi:Anti-sigma factor NepR